MVDGKVATVVLTYVDDSMVAWPKEETYDPRSAASHDSNYTDLLNFEFSANAKHSPVAALDDLDELAENA